MANKVLQILRNTTVAADLAAAKSALEGLIERRKDGEIVACRYKDKDGKLKAIIGIINKDNTVDGAAISAVTYFEGLDTNSTATLPDSVKAALDEVNSKIDTINGADTLEGSTAKKIKDAIENLDKDDAEVDGQFVTAVSETDGVITVSRKAVAADKVTATEIASGTDTVAVAGTNVKAQIEDIAKTIFAKDKAQSDAIANLDLTEVGGTGKFVQSVKQTDGKVEAVATDLNAAAVAATAITGSDAKVAVGGTDVAAQIDSLATTLKTVEKNAAKYKVVKLSDSDATALGANVREAYKVVSYVGEEVAETDYIQVGETIKIYKDATLKSAVLGTGADEQKLVLTYILADGTESVVKVDFASIAFNAEFKNGLEVNAAGEISVKKDATSESFLSVSADGVKLSGVQSAINTTVDTAVKGLDADITSAAEGHKVKVQVVETDGKVTAVNVTETDIASAQDLTDEIARAKAAEKAAKTEVADDAATVTVTADTTAADGHTKYTVKASDATKTSLGYADTALQTISATSADENAVSVSVANKSGNNGAKTQAITITPKISAMNVAEDKTTFTVSTNGLVKADDLKTMFDAVEVIDAGTY